MTILNQRQSQVQEAKEVLDRFKGWNHGQVSVSKAFGGARTAEDEIYDARRNLIKRAYEVLNCNLV